MPLKKYEDVDDAKIQVIAAEINKNNEALEQLELCLKYSTMTYEYSEDTDYGNKTWDRTHYKSVNVNLTEAFKNAVLGHPNLISVKFFTYYDIGHMSGSGGNSGPVFYVVEEEGWYEYEPKLYGENPINSADFANLMDLLRRKKTYLNACAYLTEKFQGIDIIDPDNRAEVINILVDEPEKIILHANNIINCYDERFPEKPEWLKGNTPQMERLARLGVIYKALQNNDELVVTPNDLPDIKYFKENVPACRGLKTLVLTGLATELADGQIKDEQITENLNALFEVFTPEVLCVDGQTNEKAQDWLRKYLPKLPEKIKHVSLTGGNYFTADVDLPPTVTHLTLHNHVLSQAAINKLAEAESLQELDLSGSGFNGDVPVLLTRRPPLQVLDLTNCRVNQDQLADALNDNLETKVIIAIKDRNKGSRLSRMISRNMPRNKQLLARHLTTYREHIGRIKIDMASDSGSDLLASLQHAKNAYFMAKELHKFYYPNAEKAEVNFARVKSEFLAIVEISGGALASTDDADFNYVQQVYETFGLLLKEMNDSAQELSLSSFGLYRAVIEKLLQMHDEEGLDRTKLAIKVAKHALIQLRENNNDVLLNDAQQLLENSYIAYIQELGKAAQNWHELVQQIDDVVAEMHSSAVDKNAEAAKNLALCQYVAEHHAEITGEVKLRQSVLQQLHDMLDKDTICSDEKTAAIVAVCGDLINAENRTEEELSLAVNVLQKYAEPLVAIYNGVPAKSPESEHIEQALTQVFTALLKTHYHLIRINKRFPGEPDPFFAKTFTSLDDLKQKIGEFCQVNDSWLHPILQESVKKINDDLVPILRRALPAAPKPTAPPLSTAERKAQAAVEDDDWEFVYDEAQQKKVAETSGPKVGPAAEAEQLSEAELRARLAAAELRASRAEVALAQAAPPPPTFAQSQAVAASVYARVSPTAPPAAERAPLSEEQRLRRHQLQRMYAANVDAQFAQQQHDREEPFAPTASAEELAGGTCANLHRGSEALRSVGGVDTAASATAAAEQGGPSADDAQSAVLVTRQSQRLVPDFGQSDAVGAALRAKQQKIGKIGGSEKCRKQSEEPDAEARQEEDVAAARRRRRRRRIRRTATATATATAT